MRGAHAEHLLHGCDAGRVKTQRLVELVRPLPSQKERIYVQSGQAGGFVRASKENHRLLVGTGGERTKNMNRMVVTLDVSKVSGWLNADVPCRESKGGYTRGASWEVAGDNGARSLQGRSRLQIGGRAVWFLEELVHRRRLGQAERTSNIRLMSVTLEVSQLERFSLKFFW